METLTRSDYWPQLAEIPEPPESLYLRGTLPSFERKVITMVGSRRMSQYGAEVVQQLVAGLADQPVVIVSGMALGVDGAVHRAALKHGIPTIAFPGSGLNDNALYPATHAPLARDILAAGGALVSEFPPSEKGKVHFFPKRNRLMVGVSHAVVVIEAGLRSGTLITARLAADYNRELLCVPHSIFSDGGAGGHLFMKLGAAPCRGAEDILDAVGLDTQSSLAPVHLSTEESTVLELLFEPLTRDELIRALGIPVGDALVLLTHMELKGLIAESLGTIRALR
ncbi:DNA-processing protein DprA [Patescibacteria group bacterium]|nr:DNA-processing protein DprA [Patescibacteria group bacterium]